LARTLIQQKTYGAVIPHIEAHHVFDLPIPRLEPEQEERIHRLIEQASEKRVHANKCITKAQEKLDTLLFGKNASQGDLINKKHNEFKLGITDSSFIYNGDFRLDANYHVIHGKRVASWLSEKGIELERLDAVCIPGGVFIPGRFKRIFVEDSHHGAPYLTGSFVIRLKPLQGVKLLSRHQIENKNELVLRDKMILITCSGEIGNTVYVNANFLGSVGSPDLIRVVFNPHKISPGYLYAYLHSPLARMLIQQKTYGAVIPHIEAHHLYDLLIPRFNSDQEIYIDQLIEEASDLQVKANELEDQAQQFLNGYLE
jgi:type I restriction enzyme S subunit